MNLAFNGLVSLFPGVPLNDSYDKAVSLLDKPFSIKTDDVGTVDASLVEVVEHPALFETKGFSMHFFTPHKSDLKEGLYYVKEPSTGVFPLYIQPGKSDRDGCYFQASAVHLVKH